MGSVTRSSAWPLPQQGEHQPEPLWKVCSCLSAAQSPGACSSSEHEHRLQAGACKGPCNPLRESSMPGRQALLWRHLIPLTSPALSITYHHPGSLFSSESTLMEKHEVGKTVSSLFFVPRWSLCPGCSGFGAKQGLGALQDGSRTQARHQ